MPKAFQLLENIGVRPLREPSLSSMKPSIVKGVPRDWPIRIDPRFELDETPSDVKTAGRRAQWHTLSVPPFDFGHVRNGDEQYCNCADAPGYRACYA